MRKLTKEARLFNSGNFYGIHNRSCQIKYTINFKTDLPLQAFIHVCYLMQLDVELITILTSIGMETND